MTSEWVLDVTHDDGIIRAFCPLKDDNVIIGLTMLTDHPPGRVVGVFHMDGQEAVEHWCAAHPDVLSDLGLA